MQKPLNYIIKWQPQEGVDGAMTSAVPGFWVTVTIQVNSGSSPHSTLLENNKQIFPGLRREELQIFFAG